MDCNQSGAFAVEMKRKCRFCIHHVHPGFCTGRNGGTAYPCPCFHYDIDIPQHETKSEQPHGDGTRSRESD